jgi:predicted esterase
MVGKSELSKYMEKEMGYTVVNYEEINNLTRKSLNEAADKMDPPGDPIPDDENPPFEKVEEEVEKLVKNLASKNAKIIFDGYSNFFKDDPQPE